MAPNDNLFELGATSLTMTHIVGDIVERFSVDVPVDVILDSPTLKSIVSFVAHAMSVTDAGASRRVPDEAKDAREESNPIALTPISFATSEWVKSRPARAFSDREVELSALGRLLSILSQREIDGRRRFLYPSAGDVNAVQVYVAVNSGRVAGLQSGIYYYHPVKHALVRVREASAANVADFADVDRVPVETSAVMIYLVGEFEAIAPIYRDASMSLLCLEAGYITQLMLNRQNESMLAVAPLVHVNSQSVAELLELSATQYPLCALAIGTPLPAKEHDERCERWDTVSHQIAAYASNRTIPELERVATTQDAIDELHREERHLRPVRQTDHVIELAKFDVDEHDFRLRACRRSYDAGPIAFRDISKLLCLLRPLAREPFSSLYATMPGVELDVLIYIKPSRVDGVQGGVYRYDRDLHALRWMRDVGPDAMEICYTPFNRRHYRLAAFCLFFVARGVPNEPSRELVERLGWREAGHIGQMLMERQAEMNLGFCPIGGIRLDRWRELLGIGPASVLHSFVAGRCEQFIPSSRQRLEPAASRPDGAYAAPMRPRTTSVDDLAIVGVAGRYPGAPTLDTFWENLRDGITSFSSWPNSRNEGSRHEFADAMLARIQGGFLDDIECFDHLLFNVAPAEARSMDPQERMLLELTWECLEDAGYTARSLPRPDEVGVFVGAMWNDYQGHGLDGAAGGDPIQVVALPSSLANRISHYFTFWRGERRHQYIVRIGDDGAAFCMRER